MPPSTVWLIHLYLPFAQNPILYEHQPLLKVLPSLGWGVASEGLKQAGFSLLQYRERLLSAEEHENYCASNKAILVTDHVEDCLEHTIKCAKFSCPRGIIGLAFYEKGRPVTFSSHIITRSDVTEIFQWVGKILIGELDSAGPQQVQEKVHLLEIHPDRQVIGQLMPLVGWSSVRPKSSLP